MGIQRDKRNVRGKFERSQLSVSFSPLHLLLSLSFFLFLVDYETAPNVVLNIQHGANHLGPEDFELMLEEVTDSPLKRICRVEIPL